MRPANEVMADLATSGLDAGQLALVMELSAALGREAAPTRSKAAIRQANYRKNKHNKASQNVTKHNAVTPPKEKSPQTPLKENPPSPKGDTPPMKIEDFAESWNAMAKRASLPLVKALTKSRRAAFRQRLAEHGPEPFSTVLQAVEQSDFHRGKNDRNWKADFDFVLKPDKFVRLLESEPEAKKAIGPTLPPDLETRWLGLCAKLEKGEIDRKAYDAAIGPIYAEAAERRAKPQQTEHPPPAIAKLVRQATNRA